MDGGASDNPCSETYAGPEPFSEVETNTLSSFISTVSDKLVAYIGFHSFSQLLLIPYGHSNEHVENYDELVCYFFIRYYLHYKFFLINIFKVKKSNNN